ncbi:MAG: hypothetical protein IJ228_08425 [Succinivibrio sp.]|nr:hypothetical protein [Succinivibrio sp.]
MKITKLLCSVIMAAVLQTGMAGGAAASVWDDYKARFVTPEGAVYDNANGIIHSESQGYGLMFALAWQDEETFKRILKWTEENLQDPKSGLFYWSYHPNEANHLPDKNNASDGDLFIAWTLLKAAKRFNEPSYAQKALKIATGLMGNVITQYAGLQVMLPGKDGFYYNSSVTINLSYYILPAFKAMAAHTHMALWDQLYKDALKLISRIKDAGFNVPIAPDWISLSAQGVIKPADEWPARSSFDAIRVPVYLFWNDANDPNLEPWRNWWRGHNPTNTPAWVNVTTGEVAEYPLTPGLAAVRDLVLGGAAQEPTIDERDDYYNASLKMLVFLAKNHF